jgi:hypothetical protein
MRKASTHYFVLFVVLLAAFAAYVYFQRNVLLSLFIRHQIRILTGTDAAPRQIKFFKSKDSSDWILQIKTMRIKNPDRFEIPNMVQLSDVQMVLDPWKSITESRWKIRSLYAYLPRVNFQTNGRGVFNLATLPAIRVLFAKKAPALRRDFVIEHMEFKLGRLYQLNYSKNPPSFELHSMKGRRIIYRNVDDPHMLIQAPVYAFLKDINFQDKELMEKLASKVTAYQDTLQAP